MKKFYRIFLLILLGMQTSTYASHLMGGQVTAEHISGLTYEMKTTIYRDTLGIAVGTTDQIYVYKISTGWNMTMVANVSPANYIGNGVEEYYYTYTITLPDTGWYNISFYNCCRNAAIVNLPNPSSNGMYLDCMLFVDTNDVNSSPVFMNPPIPVAQLNQPYIHNPLPFDADGDSLVWSLDLPQDGSGSANPLTGTPIAGYSPIPSAASMPLTMDPLTGEISFQPTMVGNYVLSVICQQYRNGTFVGDIRRDVQIIVIPSSNMPPANSANCNHAPIMPNTYSVSPGSNFNYVLSSTDSDNQTLEIIANGEPLLLSTNSATFNSVNGTGSATATFDWTPDASQVRSLPYLVTMSVRDHSGPIIFSSDISFRLFIGNVTTSISEAKEAEISIYPNPAQNNVTLQLNSKLDEVISISITSLTGQQIQEVRKVSLKNGLNIVQLNDLNLPSGSYILSAESNSVKLNKSLIIQK